MNSNSNLNDYIIDEEPITENYSHYTQNMIQENIVKNGLLAQKELEILKDHIKESQDNQESRKKYAKIFTYAMLIQLVAINLFVLAQGLKWINLDASIFNIFLIGVFTQLVAVVTIIFTNVFPKDHDKNKTDLQKVLFRKNRDEK